MAKTRLPATLRAVACAALLSSAACPEPELEVLGIRVEIDQGVPDAGAAGSLPDAGAAADAGAPKTCGWHEMNVNAYGVRNDQCGYVGPPKYTDRTVTVFDQDLDLDGVRCLASLDEDDFGLFRWGALSEGQALGVSSVFNPPNELYRIRDDCRVEFLVQPISISEDPEQWEYAYACEGTTIRERHVVVHRGRRTPEVKDTTEAFCCAAAGSAGAPSLGVALSILAGLLRRSGRRATTGRPGAQRDRPKAAAGPW